MHNNLKINILLLIVLFAFVTDLQAQLIQPSKVSSSEQVGDYQKVEYEPQDFPHQGYLFYNSYYIKDHYFLIGSTYFAILDSQLNQTYLREIDRDASYFYKPTFFFHKDPDKPFVISISDGMEYYEGEDIFVINSDFTGSYLGYVPPALFDPIEEMFYYTDRNTYISDFLRLKSSKNGEIVFSFDTQNTAQNPKTPLEDVSYLEYTYTAGKKPSLGEWAMTTTLQKEVNRINGDTLYKKIVTYNGLHSKNTLGIDSYKDTDECVSFIYYNSYSAIKKLVHLFSYPEESGYVIQYFDKYGYTAKTIIHEESAMNPAISGLQYAYGGKSVYTNLEEYNSETSEKEAIASYSSHEMPFNNRFLDDIKHVDSILGFCINTYQVKDLSAIEVSNLVTFALPERGHKTVVNAKDVLVRKKPQLNSKALFSVSIGDIVSVTEKGEEQTINNYGTYPWYAIEINGETGYIFGAFLEPVEAIISQ